MDVPFRSAVVTVHAHATEDENLVLESLRNVLPASAEIRKSSTKGHHGNPISIFEARVTAKKAVKEIWQGIFSRMPPEELNSLIQTAQNKVDDSCFFYLRFDKQVAHLDGLVITDIGDAIHLKFKVMSFPAKREIAVSLVEKFLEGHRRHEA